jgi:hypothetical protein
MKYPPVYFSCPPTTQMEIKQYWQGWNDYYLTKEERNAIMYAGSYRNLTEYFQESARKECLPGTNPFFLNTTWWSAGLGGYKGPTHHNDYMLEGKMRASKIHTAYFAYEKAMKKGPRNHPTTRNPVVDRIWEILNRLDEAWPFTLALKPSMIRSKEWQQHPTFKQITQAFQQDISVYLDNLESIQQAETS